MIICGANFLGIKYGAGKHMLWVLRFGYPTQIEDFLKYIYVVEILYPFVIGPIKVSICFLYIRIFGVYTLFRNYCILLIIISTLWALATLFGSVFQCNPIRDAWNPLGDRSNCLNIRLFLIGTNTPNVIIDALILTAPIYPIWRLHLSTRKKILVSMVLLLGAGYDVQNSRYRPIELTACSETAFSIVRLIKLVTLGTTDLTWDYVTPIIWSTVEPSIGLLCACVPVMGVLLPKSWMNNMSTRPSGYSSSSKKTNSFALRNRNKKSAFSKWGGTTVQGTQNDEVVDDDSSQKGIRQTTMFGVEANARSVDRISRHSDSRT